MEKIQEEFKIQNSERNKIFEHWDEMIKKIADKNALLVKQGNKMIGAKQKASQCSLIIKEKLKQIKKQKRICDHYSKEIVRFEKIIFEKKNDKKNLE